MTEDLRSSLGRIARDAVRDLSPVPVAEVRRRIRRRRAARRAAGALGAAVLLGSVGAGALALDALGPRPVGPAVPSPTPTSPAPTSPAPQDAAPTTAPTEPVTGWVPGGGVCGTTWSGVEADSDGIEVAGRVTAVDVDTVRGLISPDPEGGSLYVGVWIGPQTPGLPAEYDGEPVQVVLVDGSGTVVFWNDPERQHPLTEATDGSGSSLPSGVFDALDCRTGRPLDGVLQTWATSGDEVVALAPVAVGPPTSGADVPAPGVPVPDPAPTCGEPVSDAVRAVIADPDLVAVLAPDAPRDDRSAAGIHADVTLRATGSDVAGWLPQGLRAFLVDSQGLVVTELLDPSGGSPSGTRLHATAGSEVGAEVYQWFRACDAVEDNGLLVWPATYDLYVLDAVLTSDGEGTASVAGGPFPYTVTRGW